MLSISRRLSCTSRGAQFEVYLKLSCNNMSSNTEVGKMTQGEVEKTTQGEAGKTTQGKAGKTTQVKDAQQQERRRKFWEQEKKFEAGVDYSRLNETEKLIHKMHAEAVERGHFTYDDPENGDRVFTRLRHFLKGSCCGSACRHVPEIKKKARKFNTAYWTYDEDIDTTADLGQGLNKVKTADKKRPMVTHKMIITASPPTSENN
ncbi:hypothetical protein C0J52_21429 [Blattella germanica]|nr:hypothetical protein C0J52_21429 [Blattella germanica]